MSQKNMLHFKLLIKTHFVFKFCHMFMRSYTKVHAKLLMKGHIIIIHGITYDSNDIIDDVIKVAKFRV